MILMGSIKSADFPDHSYSDEEEIQVDSLSTEFSHPDVANSGVPGADDSNTTAPAECWKEPGLLQCHLQTSASIG